MASVHKYLTKNGRNERERTRWAVKYKTPTGKWTFKRGFKTKAEAQQFMSGVEVAVSRNEYVTPADSRATVGELAPSWLARKEVELKPSAYRPIESAWRLHVEPVWGERVLKSILPTEVETWLANLQRGTTATGRKAVGATITIRCHEILAGVLDDAVKDKRLLVNPARGLNLPRKGTKENVYLTHEQVAALAAESGRSELIYTLAYTGLRWGEAAALQVQDIDFTPGRGRINVKRNLVELNAGQFAEGTPKGGTARAVPFADFLTPHLRAACRGKIGAARVFTEPDGGPLKRPHSRDGWFVKAVAVAGIEKHITPHDLRHSAASFAVASGASVKMIQRMLGHKDATMTLNRYADLMDSEIDSVSAAMDAAYRAASGGGVGPGS